MSKYEKSIILNESIKSQPKVVVPPAIAFASVLIAEVSNIVSFVNVDSAVNVAAVANAAVAVNVPK